MEIILLAFFASIGILLVCTRTLGVNKTIKHRKKLDILVTFGLPMLFVGTFSGMITAFFAGLWFTLQTIFLAIVVPQRGRRKLSSSYGNQEDKHNGVKGNRPSRPYNG
jgi:hypothetical protein